MGGFETIDATVDLVPKFAALPHQLDQGVAVRDALAVQVRTRCPRLYIERAGQRLRCMACAGINAA